jgi:predicted PurR-regulated permease PerM
MTDQLLVPPRAVAKVAPASTPGVAELLTLAVFVAVVSGLYFAREVMVPITLAVLLSFLLAPLVSRLRHVNVPRVPAVLLSVILAVGVIVALAALIGVQIASLASDLPRYQYTMENKASVVQRVTVGRLSELMEQFGKQVVLPTTPKPEAKPATPSAAAVQKPIPVQVEAPPLSPMQIVREILSPVVAPLATSAIVFVVAVFILMQQEDLRDRLIRLFGSNDLHRTTVALDDAGRRLSRYFVTQLGINTGFGCVVGTGLLVIGVPSPLLWGVMGALLRFVPYIGSWLSALLPVALACAVDPGWSMALWTIALYTVVELTVGQVIEPLMYGHSTGLSPISVVVAAIFWSWLWGPIGLLLSTPLTLCLVVLGRHVPRLEFLDILLGDRPALTPVESFYQRILAGDADEALGQAEQILRERSLSSYYDEVVLKGLRLAAVDVERGLLQPERTAEVLKTILEIIEDLDQHDDTVPSGKATNDGPVAPPERETSIPQRKPAGPDLSAVTGAIQLAPVLCVAGRGPFDDAAAAMLAQLLAKHGLPTRVLPHSAVARGEVAKLGAEDVSMVCLCYVELAGDPSRLRYLLRRVRQQLPRALVVVGLWPGDLGGLPDDRLRVAVGGDHISATLTETVDICLEHARSTGGEPERLSA